MQSMIGIAYKYTIDNWRLTLGRVTVKSKKKMEYIKLKSVGIELIVERYSATIPPSHPQWHKHYSRYTLPLN